MELRPGYKQTEIGIIPEDWNVRHLSDLSRKITDGDHVTPKRESHGYYLLSARNVHNGRIDVSDVDYVGEEEYQRMKKRCGPEMGDILISCSGTIGRVTVVPSGFQCVLVRSAALAKVDHDLADGVFLQFWLQSKRAQGQIASSVNQGAQPNLFLNHIERLACPKPPLPEQEAIATALGDMDALLEELDRLIAKKRDLKQAAMQQLLTGKTRLPGFSGEWGYARIDKHASIKTGSRNTQDREEDGRFPFFVRSQQVERINSYSCEGEAVLTAGDGVGTGKVFHYINGRFDVHQRVYRIFDFSDDLDGRYFYYQFSTRFYDRIMSMTAKSSVDSVRMEMIAGMVIPLPSPAEQQAIAAVLSDMEAEIEAVKQRRAKTADLKQAMMQELLTGKTRLVEPQVSDEQAEAASSNASKHNWAINEAVVIATLVKHFGGEEYPLGRKRYTKLSYLLHRHVERQAEGYLKKAAGPYNPKTKYGGPERIAKQNGYIREHKGSKGHSGFIAADNVAQAESYFEKWYGPEVIQWLAQFRFKKNDDLEVLATVDMAAVELRASGKDVDVAAVKDVISSHPEWEAKLDRPVFSDANIAEAIKQSDALLGPEIAGGSHV